MEDALQSTIVERPSPYIREERFTIVENAQYFRQRIDNALSYYGVTDDAFDSTQVITRELVINTTIGLLTSNEIHKAFGDYYDYLLILLGATRDALYESITRADDGTITRTAQLSYREARSATFLLRLLAIVTDDEGNGITMSDKVETQCKQQSSEEAAELRRQDALGIVAPVRNKRRRYTEFNPAFKGESRSLTGIKYDNETADLAEHADDELSEQFRRAFLEDNNDIIQYVIETFNLPQNYSWENIQVQILTMSTDEMEERYGYIGCATTCNGTPVITLPYDYLDHRNVIHHELNHIVSGAGIVPDYFEIVFLGLNEGITEINTKTPTVYKSLTHTVTMLDKQRPGTHQRLNRAYMSDMRAMDAFIVDTVSRHGLAILNRLSRLGDVLRTYPISFFYKNRNEPEESTSEDTVVSRKPLAPARSRTDEPTSFFYDPEFVVTNLTYPQDYSDFTLRRSTALDRVFPRGRRK